jgi:hypothetical protein
MSSFEMYSLCPKIEVVLASPVVNIFFNFDQLYIEEY